jgi:hypothetical protein
MKRGEEQIKMPKPEKPEDIKILMCSLTEYARYNKREITAYKMHDIFWTCQRNIEDAEGSLKDLAFQKNCEVIVNAHYSNSSQDVLLSGMGLELKIEAEVKAGEEE